MVAVGPAVFHGMLPGLSLAGERGPWAASFGQLACRALERCLGAYPVDSSSFWAPPDFWDADDSALEMTGAPYIWTDGGREDYPDGGLRLLALVCICVPPSWLWMVLSGRWRKSMVMPGWSAVVPSCLSLGLFRLPSVLNFCHYSITGVHGRLLDHGCLAKALPLVKDGDLVALAAREQDTVRVTKVKGHATDADVDQGRVRLEDRLGNAEADTAADLGRRRQSELAMDTRRALLNAGNLWCPVILQLHRYMVAVSGVAVNHDGRGGSAPEPPVWDHGGKRNQRRTDIRVNIDLASLIGPFGS